MKTSTKKVLTITTLAASFIVGGEIAVRGTKFVDARTAPKTVARYAGYLVVYGSCSLLGYAAGTVANKLNK